MNQNEQLAKLLENSEKQLFYSRIRSIAAVVTALCILCALVMVVPALLRTAAGADAVIAQASSSITLADEAITDVIEMSGAITEMGLSMDDFIAENAEAVSSLMKEIEAIDFEGLNKAIKDLGDVVEPFAKFFNRFQ
ncbi:MAG: hypothetical protein HFI96_06925 [Lachnospiraceae bacterium]|jgi:cell division protein FtsX|nr:hypothetical protein [Lachnospiraceae bacterium]